MSSLTFIGTATTLLRIGAFTLLTDPNLLRRGQWAYLGWGLASRRRTDPVLPEPGFPALDAVLLSHLHGDHFDRVARRELDRRVPVVTTEHAARRLGRWGFDALGLPTWQAHELRRGQEELRIESVPGVHARGLLGAMLPPVMGSVLEHRVAGRTALRLYISGDTLTGEHLDLIADRHPGIDVAVLHLGGTRVLMSTVTMDADQGVDALRRIAPRQAVGIHYDDYGVFRSPLRDFLALAGERLAGQGCEIRSVARGETLSLAT